MNSHQKIVSESREYYNSGQFMKCLEMLKELEGRICHNSLSNKQISALYELMGNCYLKLKDIKKAIYYYENSYEKHKSDSLLKKIDELY